MMSKEILNNNLKPKIKIPTSSKMELIFSGDTYFDKAAQEIDKAQSEILIESYIFNLDPIGLKILQHLEAAVLRGVRVLILVDGIGSFNWIHQLTLECKKRHIHLRIYHPIPFQLNLLSKLSWKNIRRMIYFFRRLNKRNHRKIFIFDQKAALLGSFNVSQVHSEHYLGNEAWRDSGVFVNAPPKHQDILILIKAFHSAWQATRQFRGLGLKSNLKSILKRKWKGLNPTHSLFRLNNRPHWRFLLLRDLNQRFKKATARILITNAYFIPRQSVLRHLRRAARHGIYVALLLPEKTDVWFVREASRSLYLRLLKDGVHIFEYKAKILHAKTLIIDNWATVGSHNLNHRSFVHDLEVETVITDSELHSQLLQQWELDLQQSNPITIEDLGKMSWPRRMLSRILYWFRYWI